MHRFALFALLAACHHDESTHAVTIAAVSATTSATPTATATSTTKTDAASAAFDAPLHLKSGSTQRVGDVTFTVRMLPKLIVSGPSPEIEQAQIDVERGAEHQSLHVDTRNKRAAWGGVVFELEYADVYHDDISLTVHQATK